MSISPNENKQTGNIASIELADNRHLYFVCTSEHIFSSLGGTKMEKSRSPTYSAIHLKEGYGSTVVEPSDDIGTGSSGTYSAAASPYWNGPIQKAAKSPPGFHPAVAFCFTINYILGAGFLTIPWAFVQSGLVLSSIMLVLSAVSSDMAKTL